MVDDRADRAGGRRRRPGGQIQDHHDARKDHALQRARSALGAAHGQEDFLVGRDVARIEMPVPHGHAG
jgi:hypothetical protein